MSPLTLGDVLALARVHAADEATAQLRHALRNKLAAVKSAGYYLSRRLAGSAEAAADPRVGQFFKIIDDETRAACDLIEGTRALPPSAPTPPPLDAARVVADLVALLPVPAPARLTLHAPAPVLVAVSRDELVVAAHCLLANAFDAVAAGVTTITVSVEVSGPRAVVRVHDDGPGFPAGSVGAPKPGRRGLGLKVARRLATGWCGGLEVEPMARGTSVALVLPLVAPGSAPTAALAPAAATTASRGRLLLVDDDASNRVTLAALLEDAGWLVREAGSLAEARRLVGDVDVAVLDVNLGDGEGPSLIPALRAASPGALVALLTGDTSAARGAADLALRKGDDPLQVVADLGAAHTQAALVRGSTT